MKSKTKVRRAKTPIVRAPSFGLPNAPVRCWVAVAWMRGMWKSGTTDFERLCLGAVRRSYGLPPVERYAITAWRNAKGKHEWTGDVEDIPYGAAVFSQRPGAPRDPAKDAGHVFLAGGRDKNGERVFWTVDARTLGGISPVHITFFTEKWGHRIIGWTDTLNGYDLNLPPSPNERKKK